jgi:transcriptional regulator of acetoin/glycerol metabolism
MSSDRDIILWLIEWMQRHEPSITEELALRCEVEARREWGGERVEYIAKTPAAQRAAKRQALSVFGEVRPTETVDQVARRHGISRATLYRALKRGPGSAK